MKASWSRRDNGGEEGTYGLKEVPRKKEVSWKTTSQKQHDMYQICKTWSCHKGISKYLLKLEVGEMFDLVYFFEKQVISFTTVSTQLYTEYPI